LLLLLLLLLLQGRQAARLAQAGAECRAAHSTRTHALSFGLPAGTPYTALKVFDSDTAQTHAQKCAQHESWDKLVRATTAGGGNAGFYLACGAAGALLHHLMTGVRGGGDARLGCVACCPTR